MDVRQAILNYAFMEVKHSGFQGLRMDRGLKELNISKGALYHYFPNKYELGYAVVDEVITESYIKRWQAIKHFEGNPIEYFVIAFEKMNQYETHDSLVEGCILNNLIQEMSPLDEGFRVRLEKITREMHLLQSSALKRGIEEGFVKENINASSEAYFIQSAIEGAYSLAKVYQDKEVFSSCINRLIDYTKSLNR